MESSVAQYECPRCDQTFWTTEARDHHVQEAHAGDFESSAATDEKPETPEGVFVCPECLVEGNRREFKNGPGLNRHRFEKHGIPSPTQRLLAERAKRTGKDYSKRPRKRTTGSRKRTAAARKTVAPVMPEFNEAALLKATFPNGIPTSAYSRVQAWLDEGRKLRAMG